MVSLSSSTANSGAQPIPTGGSKLNPPAAFDAIGDWAQFHVQLNKRINDPHMIDQAQTNLCGPAAFMYCVAKHRPDEYRRYVLDLALHGKAQLGRLEVTPSEACRRTNAADKGMDWVDWFALASLRDSTNSVLPMTAGGTVAGITTPGNMEAWFDKCGLFHGTDNHTRLATGGTLNDIFAANTSYSTGAFVCLLVRAAIIGGGGTVGTKIGSDLPKTLLFTPDHWVVLDEPIRIGGRVASRARCAHLRRIPAGWRTNGSISASIRGGATVKSMVTTRLSLRANSCVTSTAMSPRVSECDSHHEDDLSTSGHHPVERVFGVTCAGRRFITVTSARDCHGSRTTAWLSTGAA